MNTDAAALKAEAVMDALGHRTRREIMRRLALGPRSVGELAEGLPVGRPAVSMHLRVLRRAGLVSSTGVGNRRVYRLDPQGIEALRLYLDWYWSSALDAFREAAERVGAGAAERVGAGAAKRNEGAELTGRAGRGEAGHEKTLRSSTTAHAGPGPANDRRG